jgi:DNA polymerase III subunit delta'
MGRPAWASGTWRSCFAAELLCESPLEQASACGDCHSCRLLAAGNHPDLRVVVPDALAERRPASASEADETSASSGEPAASKTKPSREIKIDQVRELAVLFGVTAHRAAPGWWCWVRPKR